MSNIVDILKSYDRKERAWLVRNALGGPPLDSAYLERVKAKLVLESEFGEDIWWSVDYHIDWLFAAAHVYRNDGFPHPPVSTPVGNENSLLKHTIQDFDLIIADKSRIVLVEAKAFGSWRNDQIQSKVARLKQWNPSGIINGLAGKEVTLHLLLTSIDVAPSKDLCADWPKWALGKDGAPNYLPLTTTHNKEVYLTVRCDVNGLNRKSRSRKNLTYWKTDRKLLGD